MGLSLRSKLKLKLKKVCFVLKEVEYDEKRKKHPFYS
jgi:hypothetical protein